MHELIKVDINKEDYYESTVSAREIYELLEVRQQFANWFQYHAKNMRLVEGVHYTKVTYKDAQNDENLDFINTRHQDKKGHSGKKLDREGSPNSDKGHGGDYSSIDYIVPIRIAEYLAMASQTRMAYKIRDIFIDIKNRYFAERDDNEILSNDSDYILDQALQLSHRALQISQKRVTALKAKLFEDKFKADFFDEVLDSKELKR